MKSSYKPTYNWSFVVLEGVRVLFIGATLLAITSYLPKPSEASPRTAVSRPDLFAPIEGIPSSFSNLPDSVSRMLRGVDKNLAVQEMDIQLLKQDGILNNG